MYSLICIQPGGGDDHQIKERLSYTDNVYRNTYSLLDFLFEYRYVYTTP